MEVSSSNPPPLSCVDMSKKKKCKLSTYSHSRFRPYEPAHPLHTLMSTLPPKHHTITSNESCQAVSKYTSPTPTAVYCKATPPYITPLSIPNYKPPNSPSATTVLGPHSFTVPTIFSRGKGKSKLILYENEIPSA